ncbi:MAG: GNAT family N-acetyltransferase [Chloroflexi bacterium AL-W]|nr:GNAT family N-acetyltransferase [Chloroflexi bacterium AL-N1]NOK64915.1 GNAT family N-acetyltransferase [Chloroflexi bacterium AL-N10]NOK76685.1 GNAT family N-acetyltransferase [Chloroflexi bacterium AL-N5]NOK84576.1 GNAT family N-acetyltransferase [Chloroflexi bacterium AL-W]NOK86599.1 GNAT family N-acetyltransferase [Chloroflexi bacterium AL-N15]
MSTLQIRQARPEDAEQAIAVLRASITQLCEADHQNDAFTLSRWLRNKQTATFVTWLNNPSNYIIVATDGETICGVGLITSTGDLDLCYVAPGQQGLGVGYALLTALEAQAWQWGLPHIKLISTAKARTFYEKHGYRQDGSAVRGHGLLIDYYYIKYVSQND